MSEAPILVVVASKNPVKLAATKEAFSRVFPTATFQYETLSVPSGVPDQPFSDRETLQGALNRARSAKELQPRADYWIGLEGGVDEWEGTLLQSFAWMAIVNREGKEGKARTSAYFLPQETAKLVRGGMELGHADDLLYGKTNSKHQGGSVGLLTEDIVTRHSYYVEAIVLALIPFNHPDKTFR